MLGHFQIYVVLFKECLSRSLGEKGSVQVVRRGRVRRWQKYNNMIRVVQDIALMANQLKRFQAVHTFLRLCTTKDLKQLVLQLFAQRGREGSIASAEVIYSIQAGGRNVTSLGT